MNELLDKMVSFGLDGLTSFQMSHDEKLDILNEVVDSIKENTDSIEKEEKLLFSMTKQAYDKILSDFKYDENILATIRSEREAFIAGIKEGTVTEYPWDEIIAWTDDYKPYLQKKIDEIELQIKKTKVFKSGTAFSNYYINDDNSLKFEVAGVNHLTETELSKVKTLRALYSNVILTAEPDNEYDANAIIVKTEDGCKIGYVNKDALPYVHLVLNRMNKCVISKLSDHDIPYVWVLIAYDGKCIHQ